MLKNTLILAFFILFFSGCFSNGNYAIFQDKASGKYGITDNNTILLEPTYNFLSKVNGFENKDYFIFEKENYYGIVDINKNIVLPDIFTEIKDFYNGIAVVKEKEKFGFINKEFQLIQKPIFLEARDFIFDISFVRSSVNNKLACIDKDMNFLSDFIYEEVFSFDTDFARVKKENKWGLIDKNCNEVINSEYDYISESIDGVFTLIKNNHTIFKNKSEI